MLKKNIITVFLCLFSISAIASIHDKSRAGIYYDHSFNPQVAAISDSPNRVPQKGWYFGGLLVDVPYNQYLTYGFSLDMFLASSSLRDYALMGGGVVNLRSMGALISGKIRPELPFHFSFGDLSLFASLEGGLGGTPALVFGSHNLSRDDDFSEYTHFPTPFPIVFNTAAKVGMEFFFSELFGIELSAGYRSLWFVHPMVKKEHTDQFVLKGAQAKKVIAYDLSSLIAGISLKMAF